MKELQHLLQLKDTVDEYRITEVTTSSIELFFIKQELQMNRGKDVKHIDVTVYVNFEEEGKRYKGSSTTKLSPTMTLDEMEELIDTAALAASFVKNEFYNLEDPSNEIAPIIPSTFSEGDMIESISNLVRDLYSEDHSSKAFINSTEFFIDKRDVRIINSNGVDVSYTSYRGEIEVITEAEGNTESIELYDVLHFSDYVQEDIIHAIKETIEYASLRALAIPMPNVEHLPVILNGAAAKELWEYYTFNASAGAKYQHLHNNNPGDSIQGKDIKGSTVTITLKPVLPNSTASRYYDIEGTYLKDTVVIKEGILETIIANKRYSDYLGIKATGQIGNTVVEGGIYSEEELKKGPYLELLKFSAFQIDSMTGDFGGEFRLGIYFDGNTKTPVTLGSIAANIKTAQQDMYLSKELVKDNNFIGPKFIKFNNVRIAGN